MAVLNGWKEIARYMGHGVRTVQRWHSATALPVHRPIGHKRSSVVALSEELDAWLKATPAPEMTEVEELRARVAPLEAENLQLKQRIREIGSFRRQKSTPASRAEYST